MNMRWMKLAFAVVFGAAATVAVTPDANAIRPGCSARCARGECSTTNGVDCGCCSDGTPICGSLSGCSQHSVTLLPHVLSDIANTGGDASVSALLNTLKSSLDGSAESSALIDAIYWYGNAVQYGEADEIEAAQEYLNDAYSATSDQQALIALRVVLNGMASPATNSR
ncbi:Hypothetical protein A7982_00506 [Minicystis rosea]|nr:Hypothetical protein A7982_00506 [Minicystis rosea]